MEGWTDKQIYKLMDGQTDQFAEKAFLHATKNLLIKVKKTSENLKELVGYKWKKDLKLLCICRTSVDLNIGASKQMSLKHTIRERYREKETEK